MAPIAALEPVEPLTVPDGSILYLHTIAREFADLEPWQTLQVSTRGRYLERRFKVPRDAATIARALAPFDPATHKITGTRFAPDEALILLHVVSVEAPESPLDAASPTSRAAARR